MKKYYCLLLFLTLLVIASYGQLPGYGYFKTITIQSSQVNGGVAHVDFPVLISHTDPDLRSILNGGNVENSNGFDIRFTASDGITLLDHQLEDYDSTSGSITIWVRIPSLSTSANTDIIMHYGNSSISVDSSVPTVWDTNYKGVWHLNNDEFDGTSNTNNLVSTGTVNAPLAEIAGGQSFSFNEKLNGGIQPELRILGDVTVESWVNFNTLQTGAGDNSIIGYGNPALANADNHSYKLNVLNTNQLRAFWEYGSGIGEGAVSTLAAPIVLGAWNHLAFSRNSTSRTITFYFNGAQLGAPVGYGNNPNGGANSEIFLGEGFPGFDLDGLLDECRVSDIERSADWMSTSYNSMSNTLGSFYTMSVQSASNGWSWMDASITNGKIQGYSIAVDSVNQSLYIAGSFDNETAFSTLNPGQINNGGGNGKLDGFLLKYDFNGTLQWVTNMGSTDDDEALGVCVGPSGNIYVTGYFKNAMRFFSASGPSVSGLGSGGGEDMFTACYNSSGGYIWSKSGTSSDNLAGHEIEANSNGLYVLGPYDKTASFGPFSTESTFNNKSANYLLKYDFAGNELWMVEMKSDGDDYDSGKLLNEYKLDLTTDQDSVYVIGEYRGTTIRFTDIGNNLLPAPQLNNADGNLNVFYGAYANDGTLGWMNQIESNDNGNLGMAIAVDCDGLYITGLLRDGAIFPNSTLTTGEHDNTFIAQVDKATGSDNWVISLGGAQHDDDIGNDIIADGYGNIIVVGQYESDPFHMPSANITGAAGAELFVTCFDNTGIFKWVQVSNGSNDDKGVSIANYGKDKIFVTGTYDQTVNLPPFSSVSGDNDNLLVAGLNTGNTGTIQACFTPCGPTITVCKNDTTVLAGPTCNYTLPDLTSSVVVNDGCGLGILSIKQNPTIGTVLSAGDHKIVITATDINNNIDTCSFKLTISADINPIIVNCGDLLLNETTIGDTNNANSFSCVSFNTPGEDRYYQITVPTGNYLLGVTISNVMDANDSILNTFWVGSGCPLGGACLSNDDYNIANQQFVSNGLNQILFNAVGPGTYYFVVDSEIDGIDSY
ncbi:MAG: DUF2341 domain-containing protein, partial [Vicingaceae bacterium]|nr:DUF2341 domain-containing protein [Vicingaceae bacterium]